MADIGRLAVTVSASAKTLPDDLRAAKSALEAGGAELKLTAFGIGREVGKNLFGTGLSASEMGKSFGTAIRSGAAEAVGAAKAAGRAIAGAILDPRAAAGAAAGFGVGILDKLAGTLLGGAAGLGKGVLGTAFAGGKALFGALLDPRGIFDGAKGVFDRLRGFGEQMFANPAKAFNDLLLGGAADLLSKIPVVGGLLAAPLQAVSGVIDFGVGVYEKNIDRVLSLGKGAAKAGLGVGDFQLLSKITGDADGAAKAWSHFNSKLAEAEMAGEGVRTVFDRFGMDGKGVAADFENDFRGALGRTFDRIASLPLAMQTLAVRELWGGKIGPEMLPSIRKGSAGVAEQADRLDRFGGGVNDALVASVRQAGKAKKEIADLWEGFGNQVTTAVAPALAEVSTIVGKLPGGFAGLGETIVDKVGDAAVFVSKIIDGWASGDTMDRIAPYWEDFRAKAGEAIDWAVERFSAGIKAAFGIKEVQEFSARFGRDDRTAEQREYDEEYLASYERRKKAGFKGAESDAPRSFLEERRRDPNRSEEYDALYLKNFYKEWRRKAEGGNDTGGGDWGGVAFDVKDNAAGMLEHLREEFRGDAAGLAESVDFFGLSAYLGRAELEVIAFQDRVRARMRASTREGEFDPYAKLWDRIDKLNEGNLGPAGEFNKGLGETLALMRGIDEANAKAAESAKDAFGQIDFMRQAEILGSSPIQGGAAELDAFAKYQKLRSAGGDTYKLAGALEKGSAGAYSAIAAYEQSQRGNTQEEVKRLLEFAQRQRDEQIRVGKDVIEAVRAIPIRKAGF